MHAVRAGRQGELGIRRDQKLKPALRTGLGKDTRSRLAIGSAKMAIDDPHASGQGLSYGDRVRRALWVSQKQSGRQMRRKMLLDPADRGTPLAGGGSLVFQRHDEF